MRMRVIAIAACITMCLSAPVSATVRIENDIGGQIGPYLDEFQQLKNSGQKVVIDGPCLSACTMLLGVIPRERICVTKRARLGFHAAWNPTPDGRRVVSHAGTDVLWDTYPPNIRKWLGGRKGLTPKMKYLAGQALAAVVPRCR